MKDKTEEKFCSRKGAFCFEYNTCAGGCCIRNLPDFTVAVSAEPVIVDVDEPVQMGTMIIADDGGITNYYTQAYVDELKVKLDAYEKSDFFKEAYIEQLKDEAAEYKSLYEDQYRKCSELQAKDLNKKYAEAIAKDYLNKNTELLGNIMTMYDRLKEAMLVRDISFGSEPAEEDVEIVTWWQVAKQFKELFNIGDYKDE
jgi:hypothetical protein